MAEEILPQIPQVVTEVKSPIPKLPELSSEEVRLAELKLPRKFSTIRSLYDQLDLDSMPKEEKIKIIENVWQQTRTTVEELLKHVNGSSFHDWQYFDEEFWQAHREHQPDFADLASHSPNLRRYCAYLEYLNSIINIYKEANVLPNILNPYRHEPCQDKSLNSEVSSQYYVPAERLHMFREIILSTLVMGTPEDPHDYYYSTMFGILNNEIEYLEYSTLGLEKIEETTEPKYEGIPAGSKMERFIRATFARLFSKEGLSRVDRLRYDPHQLPAETDKDGNTWSVAGEWDNGGVLSENNRATLYPASAINPHRFVETLVHEIGGHGFDEICKPQHNKKKLTVPPWVAVRLVRSLDNFDPTKFPATDYVARVAAKEIRGNLRNIDEYTINKAWMEQFAEMMTIFRLNPVQFVTEFGEETYKSFAMYCVAVDGDGYTELRRRQDLVINYPSLIYEVPNDH